MAFNHLLSKTQFEREDKQFYLDAKLCTFNVKTLIYMSNCVNHREGMDVVCHKCQENKTKKTTNSHKIKAYK